MCCEDINACSICLLKLPIVTPLSVQYKWFEKHLILIDSNLVRCVQYIVHDNKHQGDTLTSVVYVSLDYGE